MKDHPELRAFMKPTDVSGDNMMSVQSAKNLFNDKVLKLIQEPGLSLYLTIMRDLHDVFENQDLSPCKKFELVSKFWLYTKI